MKEIIIDSRESGQRLDRYLGRYLREAPKSFLYRMLRKKNIVLNGKKAAGNEILAEGDVLRLWLSDETMEKFAGASGRREAGGHGSGGAYPVTDLDILYEDEHVILVNKPAGMLSQKAAPQDVSLCEYLIGYLISSGQLREEDLRTVKPSVCNRLDRNTSGIVCCGKTIPGLSALGGLFRTRQVHKYYLALVMGRIGERQKLEGCIEKDGGRNVSRVTAPQAVRGGAPGRGTQETPAGKTACTIVTPLEHMQIGGREMTLVQAQLVTGRSHQIRAQLAGAGHTLAGDIKYASRAEKLFFTETLRQNTQMLHCRRIVFPSLEGALEGLSGRTFEAPLPPSWHGLDAEAFRKY